MNTAFRAILRKSIWTKTMTNTDVPNARPLETIRTELDDIDSHIHALVIRRAGLADEVRRAKTDTGAAALRPGREAQMLRRIAEMNRGEMQLSQVWRLWRELIMANARLQFPFVVDTVAANENLTLWDMGRAHFCFETTMEAHDTAQAALACTAVGPARIALVRSGDASWWSKLAIPGTSLRVFNALPMICNSDASAPFAMVVGDISLSPSGEDITVFYLQATTGSTINDQLSLELTRRPQQIAYCLSEANEALIGWHGFLGEVPTNLNSWTGNDMKVTLIGAHSAPVAPTFPVAGRT
jgi:chorismate mutase/prephenate dehydratase